MSDLGDDAWRALRGLGLVAGAVAAAAIAALLIVSLVLRLTPAGWMGRWISERTWGARDFYMTHLTRPFSWVLRGVVAAFKWLAGAEIAVEEFATASDDLEPQAKTLAAALRAALGMPRPMAAPGGVDLVTVPFSAGGVLADLSKSVKDIPQLKAVAPLLTVLQTLIPRQSFLVRGFLLPAGRQGRGLTLSVLGGRGDVSSTVTLWEDTYDPALRGDASATHDDPEGLYRMAVAGSAWVAYKVLECRGSTDAFAELGALNWQSTALFRAGVEWERVGERTKATMLYIRALERDPGNDAAAFNHAVLRTRAAQDRAAIPEFERVLARTTIIPPRTWERWLPRKSWRVARAQVRKREILRRDPLWYQASYHLAAAGLSRYLDNSQPAPERRGALAHAQRTCIALVWDLETALLALEKEVRPQLRALNLRDALLRIEGPSLALFATVHTLAEAAL